MNCTGASYSNEQKLGSLLYAARVSPGGCVFYYNFSPDDGIHPKILPFYALSTLLLMRKKLQKIDEFVKDRLKNLKNIQRIA